ncbi:hypothetical protein M513_10078 [Trichuris suis]|uniref:Uncharacterized protein n=1 Tax=Trichuris suis TaxID=68888 RepID=A0A085LVN4_9BILA|nr:hypothetical protein M513_10078 [Trichuris suis]
MKPNVKCSLLYCLFFRFESDITEPIRAVTQVTVESGMRDEAHSLGISSTAQREKDQNSKNPTRRTNQRSMNTSISELFMYLCIRNQWGFLLASTKDAAATLSIPGTGARLYNGLAAWRKRQRSGSSQKKMQFQGLLLACTVTSRLGMRKRQRLIAAKRKRNSCSTVVPLQTSRSLSGLLLPGGVTAPWQRQRPQVSPSSPPPPHNL